MSRTFEFDGEKYKKASRHQKEWGGSLIEELSPQGDEKILDLGCGDGVLTEQLSELVPDGKVVGIDASVGMIAAAQSRSKPNLTFVQMDINDMDFQNEFDAIFSNAALHWVKDHGRLLKNSFRALKDGGRLLWDFAGDGNFSNFFAVIRKEMESEEYRQYFKEFEWPWYMPSREDYAKIVAASGFSSSSISEVNRDRFFSDADEMIRWIEQPSIVPFIKVLPEGVKEKFRDEVVRAMLERTLQADGTCFETFRRIHVRADK